MLWKKVSEYFAYFFHLYTEQFYDFQYKNLPPVLPDTYFTSRSKHDDR